jgi:cystathionine beta-lyase family protein involved in aluminum resistance
MPGYQKKVVMAAGTFISGSTSELSADAPVTPPYSLYVQGCLSYFHAKLALTRILAALQGDIL